MTCLLCDHRPDVTYMGEGLCAAHALEHLGDSPANEEAIRQELTTFIYGGAR